MHSYAALIVAISLTASAVSYQHNHSDPVQLLYQYPENTWIENIAVRASGELLLTILTSPHLDQLSPLHINATPETVYSFPNATSVGGIAEIDEDVFVMSVGNFTESFQPVNGTWGFLKVDLTNDNTHVERVVATPDILFPDGLSSIPGTQDVLAGDIKTGKIYQISTADKSHEEVIFNEYTKAVQNDVYGVAGVNGIHVRDGWVYFTNTGLSIFARAPLDSPDEVEVIVRGPENVTTFQYDDFAFAPDGEDVFLVTGGGNSIEKVGLDGRRKGSMRIVAGDVNSTTIAGPTSCAFGRTEWDREVLYVVTSGGLATPVDGDVVVGAQVLAVDTRGWEEWVKGGGRSGLGWKGEWDG